MCAVVGFGNPRNRGNSAIWKELLFCLSPQMCFGSRCSLFLPLAASKELRVTCQQSGNRRIMAPGHQPSRRPLLQRRSVEKRPAVGMDVDQLSEHQKAVFKQFVENCKAHQLPETEDIYLLKWLVARNFDLKQAEKMFRESVKWRQSHRIDELLDTWTPPPVLQEYFPQHVCGQDKLGCPVWLYCYGRMDTRGVLQSVTKKDYLRYIIYLVEKGAQEMRRISQLRKEPVTRSTMIVDLDGLSMYQLSYRPAMEAGMEATKLTEANYPERTRRVFIINAPKIFQMGFAILQPLLREATINKIRFFGCDADEWKAALLEEIDASQLPTHYGGTMDNPSINQMLAAGEVPKSFYMVNNKTNIGPDMDSLTVSQGTKIELKFDVEEPRSVLRWEFMSQSGDIGWRIFRLNEHGETVDIIPWERVECDVVANKGEIVCHHRCTYVAEFDNTYSYWRSKKIWYSIGVVQAPPCE